MRPRRCQLLVMCNIWRATAARQLLLAAAVLAAAVLLAPCSAQQNNPQAIPPSFAVQPLYACKMEVKDLPQFEGMPSPEMTAGQLGLYAATLGMLDQWKIFNNGDTTDPGNNADAGVGDFVPPGGGIGGGGLPITPFARLQQAKPRAGHGGNKHNSTGSGGSSGSSSSSGGDKSSIESLNTAPLDARGAPAAEAPASTQARKYIVPRPAAAGHAERSYAAAASVAAVAGAVPAGVLSGAQQQQQQQQQLLLQPQPRATAPPAAASNAAAAAEAALPDLGLLNAAELAHVATAALKSADAAAARAGAASGQQQQASERDAPTARILAASSATPGPAAAAAAAATGTASAAAGTAPSRPLSSSSSSSSSSKGSSSSVNNPDADLGPGTSPVRRLFAAPKTDGRHVCNKGTPTNSTVGPLGKSAFSSKVGSILGITMADSGVVPADAAIAVGPAHVVHVVNGLVKILPVGPNGEFPKSVKPGQVRLVPLPDWFGLVAAPCDGGYITPSATYDKEVGRFLVSAICGGDSNQVLLSVSANSSAMGAWILYSFAGEATQGTRMQCINESYPISFHSQVGYNKDGVFLTFVHNCPSNQETATGAIIYALPKWAVYKGATYFWCPAWTAWDIFDAVGQKNNDDLYPGAFVQMQPVIPQRAVDVQAEVTYFVGDNLSWVAPLKRNIFTVAALINTGSLWLYEGPTSNAPAPLLVARVINRGMNAEIQTPDVKLTQPASDPAAGISSCQKLDGGAMRPPGVWDGGAVLYANKVYITDRGPDLAVPFMGVFMPTLYWAILSPSFCVGGPCGPWFGSDWGWADGWDWKTGTWLANSERGRYGFKDPSYYNQVFLFPSSTQPPPSSFIQGRRRLLEQLLQQKGAAAERQQAQQQQGERQQGQWLPAAKKQQKQHHQQQPPGAVLTAQELQQGKHAHKQQHQQQQRLQQLLMQQGLLAAQQQARKARVQAIKQQQKQLKALLQQQRAVVLQAQQQRAAVRTSSVADPSGTWSGPVLGSGVRITSRKQMLTAVCAAKLHAKKVAKVLRAEEVHAAGGSTRSIYSTSHALHALLGSSSSSGSGAVGAHLLPSSSSSSSSSRGAKGSVMAMEHLLGPLLAEAQGSYGLQAASSTSGQHHNGSAAAALAWAAAASPAAWARNASQLGAGAPPASASATPTPERTVSAQFLGPWGGGVQTNTFLWQGWGVNYAYFDYYQWWREHYFLRNLYMNVRIPPKVNPCKYYKDWIIDNEVTFGAINSKHGVIEFVSQGDNPVGLAAPALAVRGGSLLIAYSYSGPFNVPLTNGGIRAYPGVGYTVIDANAPSSSGGAFNLAQAGAGCVAQGGNTRWGSYSGADVHFPSYRVWTAVEYAYQVADYTGVSNAATQINVFA